MADETAAVPAAKSAKIDVIVLRDYWDADGTRHKAAWEESTNEYETDPESGKKRIKTIKHPAAVISVPRDAARKGIDMGYFKVDI